MQQIEHEEKQPLLSPADPESQPLNPVCHTQEEDEDDPEQIFVRAVAEIDTQPLLVKGEPFTFGEVVEIVLLISVLCFSFMGIVWQCITYPHTLVVLYTKAHPAQLTTTLDVSTRALAPVTITRSATIPATGQGHQKATQATSYVTFYNGLSIVQSVPGGTVFTGSDGAKITTDQTANIPPNAPPEDGYVTVPAHALHPGAKGNIVAYDVSIALSSSLTVKNLAAFTGGRDARTFKAVAAHDLKTLTSTVNETVTQAFTTAFPLQPREAAIPTHCTTKTTADKAIGEEAQSVSLTVVKTCSAIAYNSQQVEQQATAAFSQTKPGAQYHIVGSVQTTVQSVSPVSVTISGKWVYTFSQDYEQLLAQQIEGDTPAQARKVLLGKGIIAYASIPNTLPPAAMYINFLVLVE